MFKDLEIIQPKLHSYVLIANNGYISISQWLGDKFDIQPDSKLPWFKGNERIRMNDQPTHWMELPNA